MVSNLGAPEPLMSRATLATVGLSIQNNTMTTTFDSHFDSLFTGLDSTPGSAFIDLTNIPPRKRAHSRKPAGHTVGQPAQQHFVVTQPPPLTPRAECRPGARVAAAPAPVAAPTPQQRLQTSLQVIARDYPRIHNNIESMWGHRDCSPYIQSLILGGGDGMGKSRVGFKVNTVAALMLLDELHDLQFGNKSKKLQ